MKFLLAVPFLFLLMSSFAGEVYFVPGWYSAWKDHGHTGEKIQKLFPDDTVHIRKWDSNRLWAKAKRNAEICAVELFDEIKNGTPENVTVIGHSLGGRIALKCAAYLAQEKIKVNRIILLGTAGKLSPEDIKNCQQVSTLPVINIFCVDDNMLKLFLYKEKTYPLGLAGLPEPVKHFQQYRMTVPQENIKFRKITLVHHRTAEPFRETFSHLSPKYIEHLEKVLTGNVKECYYDLAALELIAADGAVKSDFIPGFSREDEFDNWHFHTRRFRRRFRITSPTGRIFHYTSETKAKENFARIKAAVLNL
jgi:pimeloyl-ACP methyl ester carboxylesterase